MAIPTKVWFALGFVLIFISGGLFIASVATPNWMTVLQVGAPDITVGLFKLCTEDGTCLDLDDTQGLWDNESDAFKAVRAMVFLAIIAWAVTIGLTTVYVVQGLRELRNTWIFIGSLAASLASLVFAIIAVAVFNGKIYGDLKTDLSYLDYSYYLSVGGGILVHLGTDLIVIGMRSM